MIGTMNDLKEESAPNSTSSDGMNTSASKSRRVYNDLMKQVSVAWSEDGQIDLTTTPTPTTVSSGSSPTGTTPTASTSPKPSILSKPSSILNLSTRTKSTRFDNSEDFFPTSMGLSGRGGDRFHDESVRTNPQQQQQIKIDTNLETEEYELFRDTFSFVMTCVYPCESTSKKKKKPTKQPEDMEVEIEEEVDEEISRIMTKSIDELTLSERNVRKFVNVNEDSMCLPFVVGWFVTIIQSKCSWRCGGFGRFG